LDSFIAHCTLGAVQWTGGRIRVCTRRADVFVCFLMAVVDKDIVRRLAMSLDVVLWQ